MRHPRIRGHVVQHRRAAEEAGIRCDEQQPRFEHQHDRQQHIVDERVVEPDVLDDVAEEDGIERSALDMPDAPQQIEQQDAASGDRQRRRHIEHRPLAGLHARLGQRIDVVRHCLDTGVGAPTLRVREQQRRDRADDADLRGEVSGGHRRARHHVRQVRRMHDDAVDDQRQVREHETEEDRQQHLDRLFHPAQVKHDQAEHDRNLHPQLVRRRRFRMRQQAE